jgi:hypothetical protein
MFAPAASVAACSVASLLLGGCHPGAAAGSPRNDVLPLRAVQFYESGVAYFERRGEPQDAARTTLPVPAGHLDDALKTLVVLGPHAKVHGVEFASRLSVGLARAQAGLPLDPDAPIRLRDLLVGLKGSPVEVALRGGTRRGRVIDVLDVPDMLDARAQAAPSTEQTPATADAHAGSSGARGDRFDLIVLGDEGELRRIPANDIVSVRPLDPAYAARLAATLDALSTRAATTTRPLRLLGEAKGSVTFGYIAETPIWRASYRLVFLPQQARAILQGWALVHNDTDEAWRGVRVSLMNGRPDSFLFPLAAPRYARRTLVTPDNALSSVPQLAHTTSDALWGDRGDDDDAEGSADANGGIALGSMSTVGYGAGRGVSESFGSGALGSVLAGARTGAVSSSSLLDVGDLAAVATASGAEAGALFTYTLEGGLDLEPHASALVPFLARNVDAKAITWVEDGAARVAVRLTNDTTQTLPAGTIAFFGAGGAATFLGESALGRMKTGETRFVSFGVDLDVELEKRDIDVTDTVKEVTFRKDALEEHFLRVTRGTWVISNRAAQPRDVYVPVLLHRNAKIEGADAIEVETAANDRAVAVFHVGARAAASRPVVTTEGLSRQTARGSLTVARLEALAKTSALGARERAVLAESAARLRLVEASREAARANHARIAALEADLVRLREHLKAFGDQRGPNPFAPRILKAEDELAAAHQKRDGLAREFEQREVALHDALLELESRAK